MLEIAFAMAVLGAVLGWEIASRCSQMLTILVLQSALNEPSDSTVSSKVLIDRWTGSCDWVTNSCPKVTKPLNYRSGRNLFTGHDV